MSSGYSVRCQSFRVSSNSRPRTPRTIWQRPIIQEPLARIIRTLRPSIDKSIPDFHVRIVHLRVGSSTLLDEEPGTLGSSKPWVDAGRDNSFVVGVYLHDRVVNYDGEIQGLACDGIATLNVPKA